MRNHIENYFFQSQRVSHDAMNDLVLVNDIMRAANILIDAINDGKKILACGNGGSMSDAMHFASELIGKYKNVRAPLPAIALSDVAAMTCISNDFAYDAVFSRQVTALGNRGDVLLAISTSGRSRNVLMAIHFAKEKGMKVVVLTGKNGIKDGAYPDVEIQVPSMVTNLVQECHIKIIHILVELIEKHLKPKSI